MKRGIVQLQHTPGSGDAAVRSTDNLRFLYMLLYHGQWRDR